jgi:hypothetical protein
MESTNKKLEVKDSSTPEDSGKGSKEGCSQGELLCMEASQGATGHNTGSENTESLTEKVGTLGLKGHKSNQRGAPGGGRGRIGLRRLLLENPPVANLGRFKAINHILNRRPVHLGLQVGGLNLIW